MRYLVILCTIWLWGWSFGQSAQAQGCDGLNEGDCALWRAIWEQLPSLETAAIHLNIELSSENILGQTDKRLRLVGDGLYHLERLERLAQPSLPLMTVLDSGALDIYVRLEAPPDILPLPVRLPSPIAFDLRLVEGVLYLNLDKVAAADTSGRIQSGWHGVDLSGADENLAALSPVSPFSYLPALVRRLPFRLTRLDDTRDSGVAAARFRLAFDGETALAAAEARAAAALWLEALLRERLSNFSDDSDAANLVTLYVDALADLQLEAIITADKATAQLRMVNVTATWQPKTETLLGLLRGGDPLGVTQLGLQFTFSLDIILRKQSATFRAPEAAKVIELADLLYILRHP